MKRKLIAQGGGGMTIYLPKKWVQKKGLKPGDQVDVLEQETALIISGELKAKREHVIEITKQNRQDVKNLLTHAYRNGSDSILIKDADATLIADIKQWAEDLLLGFEVTECTGKACILENIFAPMEEKYDPVLRRVFLIIKESIALMLRDLKSNAFKNQAEMSKLRLNTDKYVLFCKRMLIKETHSSDIVISWELLSWLMHIQHALYYMYVYAAKHTIHKDVKLVKFMKDFDNYFNYYYRAFYDKDLEAIHKINELKGRYQFGACLRALEQSKGNKTVLLMQVRELFRFAQLGSSPVLTLLLR